MFGSVTGATAAPGANSKKNNSKEAGNTGVANTSGVPTQMGGRSNKNRKNKNKNKNKNKSNKNKNKNRKNKTRKNRSC